MTSPAQPHNTPTLMMQAWQARTRRHTNVRHSKLARHNACIAPASYTTHTHIHMFWNTTLASTCVRVPHIILSCTYNKSSSCVVGSYKIATHVASPSHALGAPVPPHKPTAGQKRRAHMPLAAGTHHHTRTAKPLRLCSFMPAAAVLQHHGVHTPTGAKQRALRRGPTSNQRPRLLARRSNGKPYALLSRPATAKQLPCGGKAAQACATPHTARAAPPKAATRPGHSIHAQRRDGAHTRLHATIPGRCCSRPPLLLLQLHRHATTHTTTHGRAAEHAGERHTGCDAGTNTTHAQARDCSIRMRPAAAPARLPRGLSASCRHHKQVGCSRAHAAAPTPATAIVLPARPVEQHTHAHHQGTPARTQQQNKPHPEASTLATPWLSTDPTLSHYVRWLSV
jgi:hypothetical protein